MKTIKDIIISRMEIHEKLYNTQLTCVGINIELCQDHEFRTLNSLENLEIQLGEDDWISGEFYCLNYDDEPVWFEYNYEFVYWEEHKLPKFYNKH